MVWIVTKHFQGSVEGQRARPGVTQTQDLHGDFAFAIDKVNLACIRGRETQSTPNKMVHERDIVLTRRWHGVRHDDEQLSLQRMRKGRAGRKQEKDVETRYTASKMDDTGRIEMTQKATEENLQIYR